METFSKLFFEIPLHQERLEIALERLSKKKLYLKRLETESKHSQSYLNTIANEIRDFENLIESYENIIQMQQQHNKETAREQYQRGRKEEREINLGGTPNKYWEKEAYRAFHELEIKNRWSNLY